MAVLKLFRLKNVQWPGDSNRKAYINPLEIASISEAIGAGESHTTIKLKNAETWIVAESIDSVTTRLANLCDLSIATPGLFLSDEYTGGVG